MKNNDKCNNISFSHLSPTILNIVFDFSLYLQVMIVGHGIVILKLFANTGYTETEFSSTGQYEKLINKLFQSIMG